MRTRSQRKSKTTQILATERLQQNINFRRQKEIFDPQVFQKAITIIGLGNIGSQTALALARLGLKEFYLYDPDIVEEHNLSSQSYFRDQIQKTKVSQTRELLKKVNKNISAFCFDKKFDGKMYIDGFLIIAVDSMKERKLICKNLQKTKFIPKFIIDGRMGGPQLEIYSCKTLEEWEKTFVDNPSTESCGARYICYISMIIGALIANQVKRVLKNETYKESIIFNIDSLQLL